MDGESAGLNLHTREVNREHGDGLLASFTATPKETKVTEHSFISFQLYRIPAVLNWQLCEHWTTPDTASY